MARRQLRIDGEVLLPGTEAYEQRRRVWNAMIDRRPALIARCLHAEDVAAAIRHARERRPRWGAQRRRAG